MQLRLDNKGVVGRVALHKLATFLISIQLRLDKGVVGRVALRNLATFLISTQLRLDNKGGLAG
jgi:hypothetical protein